MLTERFQGDLPGRSKEKRRGTVGTGDVRDIGIYFVLRPVVQALETRLIVDEQERREQEALH